MFPLLFSCVSLRSCCLTFQVQLRQCWVCLECITQRTRSFSASLVVCQPHHVPSCFSCSLVVSPCGLVGCSPHRFSFVSVVFVLSASPSAHAPSLPILLSAQSPGAIVLFLRSCCVFLWSCWLFTTQVQLCQRCVCLECIAQCAPSFITDLVACQSLHVPLCLLCTLAVLSLLLPPQVQHSQCCVCHECFSQSTRSFIPNSVVCSKSPLWF